MQTGTEVSGKVFNSVMYRGADKILAEFTYRYLLELFDTKRTFESLDNTVQVVGASYERKYESDNGYEEIIFCVKMSLKIMKGKGFDIEQGPKSVSFEICPE